MFIVQFYDKLDNVLLGSDNCLIFKDLKTLKGVKNRIEGYKPLNPVAKRCIFKCDNIYNENTYQLLDTLYY